MTHSNNRRHQSSESRRSTNLALNPYLIEDTALTRSELERGRTRQVSFIEPR